MATGNAIERVRLLFLPNVDSCVCQVLQKSGHLDHAVEGVIPPEPPVVGILLPERSAVRKGAPGFGAA